MFIRTKTISGKSYLYLVQTYRDKDGKNRQRQRYMGKGTKETASALTHGLYSPRKIFNRFYWAGVLMVAQEQGRKPRNVYDYKQKEVIYNMDWIKRVVGDMVVHGRVKKSTKRGVVNQAMLYQLIRIEDEATREEVYKVIKMKRLRSPKEVKQIVEVALESAVPFKCKDLRKISKVLLSW